MSSKKFPSAISFLPFVFCNGYAATPTLQKTRLPHPWFPASQKDKNPSVFSEFLPFFRLFSIFRGFLKNNQDIL